MRDHHYAFLYSAILHDAVMVLIKGKATYFRDKDAINGVIPESFLASVT